MSETKAVQLMEAYAALGQENQGLRQQIVDADRLLQEQRRAIIAMQEEVVAAAHTKARYHKLAVDIEQRQEHLKELERSHGAVTDRIAELGVALERAQSENQELARRAHQGEALVMQYESHRANLGSTRSELDAARQEIEALRRDLHDAAASRSEVESRCVAQLASMRGRLADVQEELRVERSRRDALEEMRRELQHTVDALDADCVRRQQQAAEAESLRVDAVERLEAQMRSLKAQHAEERDVWVVQRSQLMSRAKDLENRVTKSDDLANNTLEEMARFRETHQRTLNEVHADGEAQLHELRGTIASLEMALHSASTKAAEAETRWRLDLDQMNKQLEEHVDVRAQWSRDRELLHDRIHDLEARNEDMELTLSVQQDQLRLTASALADADDLRASLSASHEHIRNLEGERDDLRGRLHAAEDQLQKNEDISMDAMRTLQKDAVARESVMAARIEKLEKRIVYMKAKRVLSRVPEGGADIAAEALKALEQSNRRAQEMLQQVSTIAN
eukprot:PhM_4_TR3200/c0_g2_i1/m.38927